MGKVTNSTVPSLNHFKSGKTVMYNDPAKIKRFQKYYGLHSDGIVGPKTRKAFRQHNVKYIPGRSGPGGDFYT